MEQTFLRLERGISTFWVRDTPVGGEWDDALFGRGPSDTATDVSRTGETRRGREGNSWDVGLDFDVACVRSRGLCVAFEGLHGLRLGGDGPSDKPANAAIHASRSPSDTAFVSRLDLLPDKGIWVTKVIGLGRADGG